MRYVSRYVLADDDGPGVAAVTVRAAGGPFTITAHRRRGGFWRCGYSTFKTERGGQALPSTQLRLHVLVLAGNLAVTCATWSACKAAQARDVT